MPNLRRKTWTTTTPANVEDAQYWEDHLISDSAAAKAASSVQSVNNTAPDEQGNVDIVALPDGGTAGQVLTKQSSVDGDADWEDPASSGHTIEDEDGNTMPYQSTLQFENAEVTNDSVNNKTIVDCKGSKGDAATITVGTVTTLPAGSDATVTNSGTSSDAVFDFGIPKGKDSAEEEIEQIYADNGVLGAKNLLPNNATSQTVNGVTFTVNDDGSITANGTATQSAVLDLAELKITNVIFSGCPRTGSDSTYKLSYVNLDSTSSQYNDYGNSVKIPSVLPTTGRWVAQIVIYPNYTANNLIFHPMLRLASDPDDTYVPYAMTNRELTEKVTPISSNGLTLAENVAYLSSNDAYVGVVGSIKYVSIKVNGIVANADTWVTVGTVSGDMISVTGKNLLFECKKVGANEAFDAMLSGTAIKIKRSGSAISATDNIAICGMYV